MKKKLCAIALIGLMLCNTNRTFSQATSAANANNPINAGEYLGWANGNAIPLKIQNINTQPIEFYTGTGPTQYMTILGSTNPGYVGIGTATPNNLLHLYNSGSGAALYCQWSNGNGSNTNGLQVGINTSNQGMINMVDNKPIKILTNNVVRMIVDDNGNNGYVGMGTSFTTPFSRLHLHNAGNTDNWFQISTANSVTSSLAATDGLRIGVVDATQNVEIKQQENADIVLFTNATEQMRIKASGSVGIGTNNPGARLEVYAASVGNASVGGIYAHAVGATGNANNYAVYGHVTTTGTGTNTALNGEITAEQGTAYGLNATVTGASTNSSKILYGMSSTVTKASTASQPANNIYGADVHATNSSPVAEETYGGRFIAAGTTNSTVYGVKGDASGGSVVNYGIYGVAASTSSGSTSTINLSNPGNAAGYFAGDVYTTNAYWSTSDGMFKTNVVDLNNASATISQLQPKTYYLDTVQFPQMHFSSGQQFGLLAQDVQNILPQFTKHIVQPEETDASGTITHASVDYLAITYQPLITLLIASNKEMQQQITDLQNQMANINNGQMRQGNNNNNANEQMKVELGDGNKIIYLTQNIPNPFNDNTQISFNIPDDVKSASIMFSDNNGNVIKTVEINSRGKNSLMVFGENLSKGIYSYTLIVDGKIADSKRMVKQ